MTTSGSYRASEANISLDAEIARLRAQALISWPKEARILQWFGLSDGMSVLEPGSGPGFITEQLLTMLPHSQISALDADPLLNQRATEYLQGKGDERLHIVEASVMDTGLPDNSFDFAIARLLFLHLPDPVGAARELHRVLKPGGRLVVIDVDDEMVGMADPDMSEFKSIMDRFAKAAAAQGGNRHIGKQLGRVFAAAGFQNFAMEAVSFSSDELGMEPFLPQFELGRMTPMVAAGLISEQEIDGLRAARERFLGAEHPFILMLLLMACGQKPE